MTDKEAYELMVKYSGGEEGIIKIRQMIHELGVGGAVIAMVQTYRDNGKDVPGEFITWMEQSYEYLARKMAQPDN